MTCALAPVVAALIGARPRASVHHVEVSDPSPEIANPPKRRAAYPAEAGEVICLATMIFP
jgi:hypothetical protein